MTLASSDTNLVRLRSEALSDRDGIINFFAVDQSLYNNVGSSSLFEINFSNRGKNDPDFCHPKVQQRIEVKTMRWDSLHLATPELLVMDCEGAELLVLRGFGVSLRDLGYVVLEVSQVAIGHGACTFKELDRFLTKNKFRFVASNLYGHGYKYLKLRLALSAFKKRIQKPFGSPLKGRSFDVVYKNIRI